MSNLESLWPFCIVPLLVVILGLYKWVTGKPKNGGEKELERAEKMIDQLPPKWQVWIINSIDQAYEKWREKHEKLE